MADFLLIFVLIVFSGIMIAWNIYLMKQNQALVNKVMSRNYGDYAVSVKHESAPLEKSEETESAVDPYAEHKAREINTMMGMG